MAFESISVEYTPFILNIHDSLFRFVLGVNGTVTSNFSWWLWLEGRQITKENKNRYITIYRSQKEKKKKQQLKPEWEREWNQKQMTYCHCALYGVFGNCNCIFLAWCPWFFFVLVSFCQQLILLCHQRLLWTKTMQW